MLYEYGAMGAAYNRAGRITKITDESGVEERQYGKLGETLREEKTVEAHTPAVQRKKFSTDYVFDSFGRMQEMTYPDGEKLHYAYDNGGLLKAAWGEKSGNRYDYITKLHYDEFGQRTNIVYGNGTKTTYSYDDKTRRLDHLTTVLKDGRTVQNIAYDYDLVGNIGETWNNIQVPTNTALPAGPVKQKFEYDDQYQIVDGKGWYSFGPGKENNYHNEFMYDTIGNFTRKKQEHKIIQPSMSEHLPKETNYVLNYQYKFKGNGITKPHAVSETDDKLYTYDTAGNMTGWTSKANGTRRTITWNEENRVKQIDDNGKSTYFLYDDAGERVVKRGQHGESIYVNRFYSIRSGELGTKSVYAGETRVVSKLVKTPPTNTANTTASTTTSPGTATIPGEQGLDNGRGKKLGIIKRLPDGYTTGVNPPVEKDEFYYHGDHLGSSNMITDAYGAVYQHLEYFPYGETWIEEGGSYGGNTPGYKFTGKELDPETGLYYFGARYYDSKLTVWISDDPAFGDHIYKGHGRGVFISKNLALYQYSFQNPLTYVDPNGRDVHFVMSAQPVGYAEIRLIGQESHYGAPRTVTIPLYTLTVTDDATKKATTYHVTRDAPILNWTEPETKGKINVKNVAFEPAAKVAKYRLVPSTIAGFGAYALRNLDGTRGLNAIPVESPFRKQQSNVATDVTIHIGGEFITVGGVPAIAGSEGCFSLSGKDSGNKGLNRFVNDVWSRQSENKKAGKGAAIDLKIYQRQNVKWEWQVDKTKGE